jgi:hypothetical protein
VERGFAADELNHLDAKARGLVDDVLPIVSGH